MNHISYELAKKLKDAGFPQMGHGSFGTIRPSREDNMRVLIGEEPVGEKVYLPTLEELIEACGEGFDSLDKSLSFDTVQWFAFGTRKTHLDKLPTGKGSTPSEAVARLWLALNKKI